MSDSSAQSSSSSGSSSSGSDSDSGSGREERQAKRARVAPVAAPVAAAAAAATPVVAPAVEEPEEPEEEVTFASIGIVAPLCEACAALGWTSPTPIQREALPPALEGRDIIGIAETGSGKTAAFALPVLQALLKAPQRLFALVLAPTRELAFQINEQFEALGGAIDAKCAVIVGGTRVLIFSEVYD